jgi:predicted GNAT family acetyltransferase
MEMQIGTTDNVDFSRFEVYADGRLAGYSSYRIRNGRMSMLHTWTDPGFQRRGLASAVVRAALESARLRNLKVLPYCGFVAGYIRHNDQYLDLVPEDQRKRFNLQPKHGSGAVRSGHIKP